MPRIVDAAVKAPPATEPSTSSTPSNIKRPIVSALIDVLAPSPPPTSTDEGEDVPQVLGRSERSRGKKKY
ncbi:hypothetical protein AX14_006762, partial [Amanita brunnescens Koide BX004]